MKITFWWLLMLGWPSAAAGQARYTFEHGQMGTRFRLTVHAPDSGVAQRAATAAFARLDSLNATLSDYRDDSELSRLSATAGTRTWVRASPDLWAVATAAQNAARLTHGAFDLTVGPLVQLWRRAARQRELPSPARLRQAKRLVGRHLLRLDPARQAICLPRAGMKLDAGGIGKGYALGQMGDLLRAAGLGCFLIEGGGDLLLGQAPPGLPGWRVAVGDSVLYLAHTAVATSGDRFRHADIGGRRYSHVVDPRTGLGVTHGWQVTVLYPDPTLADALASGLGVLGPERGGRAARRLPGLRYFFLRTEN
jgi:FAD:protein FMN transferase